MKILLVYKSDKTGKAAYRTIEADCIPQPRVGDAVFAEGRPRQVSSRRFHYLGARHSGNWWNTGFVDNTPYVEIRLIG